MLEEHYELIPANIMTPLSLKLPDSTILNLIPSRKPFYDFFAVLLSRGYAWHITMTLFGNARHSSFLTGMPA